MTILNRLISALFTFACLVFAAQATMPLNSAAALQSAVDQTKRTATIKFLNKSNSVAPLKFDDSKNLIIFPAIVNGVETWALLNTEAGTTVIDRELAKRIGAEKADRKFTGRAGRGEKKGDIYLGVDLKIPGQFQGIVELPALDLDPISRKVDKKIGVIIGFNIIKAVSIYIDTKNNLIQFGASRQIKFGNRPHYNIPINNGFLIGNINGKKPN